MTEPPLRLERFGPLALAALCRHHRLPKEREDLARAISAQWREFTALRRGLRPSPADIEYGVVQRMADGAKTFDYCCGVPIAGTPALAPGLVRIELPPLHCAVFDHASHASMLRETMELMLGTILPEAGLEPADEEAGAPEFIERYGRSFDPQTGLGGLEVLIPLKE